MKTTGNTRTFYCSDCEDDWVTSERGAKITTCTQCCGSNIKETTDEH